jgi:hypothetical protein
MAWHRWKMQQHCETGRAFNQGADRGAVQADDQIALPVAGHGTVGHFGRALTDHHLGGDKVFASLPRSGARHPERPACTQTRAQFALQRAAALNVERLIEGFVGDPH